MNSPKPGLAVPVSIVTQTRVHEPHASDFARWQLLVNDIIARAPGYLDSQLIPPSPPIQQDWVIVQRFNSQEAARAWLTSRERIDLVNQAQPWLVGIDDVHLIDEPEPNSDRAPVSAVIATRVQPGNENRFLDWQQRIAAVQTRFAGFQGYKLQPPTPGIHDDWVTILRFDSQANLDAWLASPERQRFIAEAESYTGDTHIRTVKSGFDAWFPGDRGAQSRPRWKQNMTVLLVLYPVVFLFGRLVGEPVFEDWLDLPFWFSLFLSNAASVMILSVVVPGISARLDWWLAPKAGTIRITIAGVFLLLALYGVLLFAFWLS
jgi:antibiotic biosynthesis monooxygenase (ABM) superfamily enzyme